MSGGVGQTTVKSNKASPSGNNQANKGSGKQQMQPQQQPQQISYKPSIRYQDAFSRYGEILHGSKQGSGQFAIKKQQSSKQQSPSETNIVSDFIQIIEGVSPILPVKEKKSITREDFSKSDQKFDSQMSPNQFSQKDALQQSNSGKKAVLQSNGKQRDNEQSLSQQYFGYTKNSLKSQSQMGSPVPLPASSSAAVSRYSSMKESPEQQMIQEVEESQGVNGNTHGNEDSNIIRQSCQMAESELDYFVENYGQKMRGMLNGSIEGEEGLTEEQSIQIQELEKRHLQQVSELLASTEQFQRKSHQNLNMNFNHENQTPRINGINYGSMASTAYLNKAFMGEDGVLVQGFDHGASMADGVNGGQLVQVGEENNHSVSVAMAMAQRQQQSLRLLKVQEDYEEEIAAYQRELAQVRAELELARYEAQKVSTSSYAGGNPDMEFLNQQLQSLQQVFIEKKRQLESEIEISNAAHRNLRGQLRQAIEQNSMLQESVEVLVTENLALKNGIHQPIIDENGVDISQQQQQQQRMEEVMIENSKIAEICEKLTVQVEDMQDAMNILAESEAAAKAQVILFSVQMQGLQSLHADLQQAYQNVAIENQVFSCQVNQQADQIEVLRAHLERETTALAAFHAVSPTGSSSSPVAQLQLVSGDEEFQSEEIKQQQQQLQQQQQNQQQQVEAMLQLRVSIEACQAKLEESRTLHEQREQQWSSKLNVYKEKKRDYREKLRVAEAKVSEITKEFDGERDTLKREIERIQSERKEISGLLLVLVSGSSEGEGEEEEGEINLCDAVRALKEGKVKAEELLEEKEREVDSLKKEIEVALKGNGSGNNNNNGNACSKTSGKSRFNRTAEVESAEEQQSSSSDGLNSEKKANPEKMEELMSELEEAKEAITLKEERITQLTQEYASYSLKMAEREEEFNKQFDLNEKYLHKLLARKNEEYQDLSSEYDSVQETLSNLQEEFKTLKQNIQ